MPTLEQNNYCRNHLWRLNWTDVETDWQYQHTGISYPIYFSQSMTAVPPMLHGDKYLRATWGYGGHTGHTLTKIDVLFLGYVFIE